MSLFNYSKCDECKMLKITTLKVLNEYFLPEITKKKKYYLTIVVRNVVQ